MNIAITAVAGGPTVLAIAATDVYGMRYFVRFEHSTGWCGLAIYGG